MAIVIGGVSYCTGSSQGNVGGGSPILTPCPGQQIGSPGAGGSAASNTPVNSPYVPPPVFNPVGDPPPAGIVQLQYLAAPASVYMATINPALLGMTGPMYYATSPTGATGTWSWSNAGMTSSAGALMWFQVFNGVAYAFCTGGLFVQEQAGVSPWVLRTASPPNIMGGYVAPSGHILMTTNDNQNLANYNSNPSGFTSVWSSTDAGVTFEKIYSSPAGANTMFDGVIAPFSDVIVVGLNTNSNYTSEWYEVTDSASGFTWGSLNTAASAAFAPASNDYFSGNGLQALQGNNNLAAQGAISNGYLTSVQLSQTTQGCLFSFNNTLYGGGTLAEATQSSLITALANFTGPYYANNSKDPVEPEFAPAGGSGGGGGFGYFNAPATVLSGPTFSIATVLGAAKTFSSIAYQTIAPGAIMGVDGEKNLFYSPSGAPLSGVAAATNFALVGTGAMGVFYVPPIGTNIFAQGGFVIVYANNLVSFAAADGASIVAESNVPFLPLAAAYNDAAVFVTGANGQSAYSYDLKNWTSTSTKTGTADLPSAWGGKVT